MHHKGDNMKKQYKVGALSADFVVEYGAKEVPEAFIKVATPVPVKHCPTCGVKIKRVRK